MYLFTRTARLAPGRTREALEWAVDITDRVNRFGVVEAHLWTRVFSPGLGTLVWSTTVPDLATLETADAKFQADGGYLDAVDRGSQFTDGTGVDDLVASIVHGQLDPHRQSEYVAVVTATLAPGAIRDGMALAMEIADRATALCGSPTALCMATTGAYGGIAWMTGYATVEELERGEQAVISDESFLDLLDTKAATAFLDGATQYLRRIL